jgi:sugar-phosphatase
VPKGLINHWDMPMTKLMTTAAPDTLIERSYDAFLFDMDGTLLNSIAVVERVWREWAVEHGIDVEAFMRNLHGVRAIEVIRREAIPGMDAEEQAEIVLQKELDDVEGIVEIPGAGAFLGALPPQRWAIVTSAVRSLALKRLAATGLPVPKVLICSDDVVNGKPDPEGYRKAARLLGFDPKDCVVFEDAHAGIEAAERMQAGVVVVTATHSQPVDVAHFRMRDFRDISVQIGPAGDLRLSKPEAR